MSGSRFRLSLAVTAGEMAKIARILSTDFPDLAAAIDAQWDEVTRSEVNVFGDFVHTPTEPIAGLSRGEIERMAGYTE